LAATDEIPQERPVTDFQVLSEERISEIAMQTSRKNFKVLCLTLASAGLTAPSPWLTEDVHLATGELRPQIEPMPVEQAITQVVPVVH